jgi:hypothetical protein
VLILLKYVRAPVFMPVPSAEAGPVNALLMPTRISVSVTPCSAETTCAEIKMIAAKTINSTVDIQDCFIFFSMIASLNFRLGFFNS